MENRVSKEIYEQVKTQVLAELEAKKRRNREISLEAEAVFAQAKRKYWERLIEKYGSVMRADGSKRATGETWDKFNSVIKLALEIVGFKTARQAYLNGYGEEANKMAEQLFEAMLTD